MHFFLFKFNCAWFIWFGFAHQEDNNTPSSKLKNPIKIGKLHFYGIFGEMNLISSQSLLDNIGIKKLKNFHQFSFPLLSLVTLPRIDLLCMKNWGTQWTIEISSNE